MSSTSIIGTGLTNPHQIFCNNPNYVNLSTVGSTGVIITMAPGAAFLRLVGNIDFYVMWGSSGVSATANSTGAASEFIPYTGGAIYRKLSTFGTTMISISSTAACNVTQSWWCI